MLLGIDNFEQFKIFFEVVYDITDLIELQLFKTHMTCSILDKAHTRFMNVEFKKDFFAVYEVEDAESVTLFAEDMHKIIKSVKRIDSVILETNENYLICKIKSKSGNSRVFEFVLPADYIESPKPPSLSLPVKVKIDLSDLKQGVKDLGIVGSSEITFTVNGELLNITAGTEVSTNYALTIMVDEVDGMYSSRFSLEYIEQLLDFNKISNMIELEMGSDNPLVYSVSDEIMGVNISGLIAPRIEVED